MFYYPLLEQNIEVWDFGFLVFVDTNIDPFM
jgi:hypothetical protein